MDDKKDIAKVGYKQFKFPKWIGYKDLDSLKDLINAGSFNEPNSVLEYAAKMYIERQYFHDMLLFIQAKLNTFNAEPLGLCLNSAEEQFDIMITPCEIVKLCPYCESELIINEENKTELECPYHQCPYISSTGRIYREDHKEN